MYNGQRSFSLFGEPIQLRAMGWTADTSTLAHCGWEIYADQNVREDRLSIAGHHPKSGMGFMSQYLPWGYRDNIGRGIDRGLTLQAALVHRDKQAFKFASAMDFNMTSIPKYERVDPYISVREEVKSIADLLHFKPYTPTQIMVEQDPTIDDLLAQIIAKQAKGNDEYFAEKAASGKLVQASSAEIIQFARKA